MRFISNQKTLFWTHSIRNKTHAKRMPASIECIWDVDLNNCSISYNFNLPFKSTRNVGCSEIKKFIKGAQCPLKHGNYVAMVKREILPWSDVPLFMTSVSIASVIQNFHRIFNNHLIITEISTNYLVNNSLRMYTNNKNQCMLANVGTNISTNRLIGWNRESMWKGWNNILWIKGRG